ncbi:hypothetical protein L1887_31269 [Cichorium endivia]|nr:hypothetical protein L1887_31269 [Cichorium endivia]
MDRGKGIMMSEVPVEGTSGLLPHEKSDAETHAYESEDELEPVTPLNLSEQDEEEDPEEPPWSSPSHVPVTPRSEYSDDDHVEHERGGIPLGWEYETFYMPDEEYTPMTPERFWKQLHEEDMAQATSEIQSLKRKIEEIDEDRTRLGQERCRWIEADEQHRRKIRKLEKEMEDLKRPTIYKLWGGFVGFAKKAKAATHRFIDVITRRDPPEPEVLVIQSGPGDRKARKIRKYLKEGKRVLKYEDIVFKD